MGVPVELRCPFLDHRVVDLGFSLPLEFFIHDGWTKWILRVALGNDLPATVAWRREKMGFPFPLEIWLTQSEAYFMTALVDLDCPFVDVGILRRSFGYLCKTDPNYLWYVLSLSLWWEALIQIDRHIATTT